jgi:hypothetical protein
MYLILASFSGDWWGNLKEEHHLEDHDVAANIKIDSHILVVCICSLK